MKWCRISLILEKVFPILKWNKTYNIEMAISDLFAGITVGMTLIPQSMAYASLAELGPQYGLYSSICGGFVYVFFGTVPELQIAPTALLSLLTYSHTLHTTFGKHNAVVLLCFASGVVELLSGLLHLGFLVDFVSTPVVAAFTSAGAITIATSQIKNLLGLHFKAESFTSSWYKIFEHIKETRQWDAILGVSCFIILLILRKLKDVGDLNGEKRKFSKIRKVIWFISISRNAFVVIGCSVLAFYLQRKGHDPFSLTGNVPNGLPNITFPRFEVVSEDETYNLFQMLKQLGTGILVVPFIAILGNVAIAKAFAKGKAVDASQEMFALGICNMVSSCFGSYPINASFSRGAISNASSVRTPTAGIYSAILVILSLTFLTPFFSYIPKPTLAAVVISAVLFMVEVTMTKLIWKINKVDLLPFTITLLSCLLIGLEIGIIIGVCVDIVLLLYASARPKILFEVVSDDIVGNYIKITPTSALTFPSAEYIRERIIKCHQNEKGTENRMVVIDCHRIHKVDFTAGKPTPVQYKGAESMRAHTFSKVLGMKIGIKYPHLQYELCVLSYPPYLPLSYLLKNLLYFSIYLHILQCLGALITDLKNNSHNVVFLRPRLKIVKILRKVCPKDLLIAESEDELLLHLKKSRDLKLSYSQPMVVESFKQVNSI